MNSIPENLEIQVSYRGTDWIARLKNKPTTWDCGSSPEIAIGKLIISLNGSNNISVEINIR